jgi:quercetin dioxygenase-like cupin family protein
MKHLSVDDAIDYRERQRTKQRVIITETMTSELLCYEPGQGTVAHHHVDEDEAFLVLEGRGTISVDDENFAVEKHSLVFAPVGSKHGLQADRDSRMSVIYFRSPGRAAKKMGMVIKQSDEKSDAAT